MLEPDAKCAFAYFQIKLYFLICVFLFKTAFWTLEFTLSQPSIHKTGMEGVSSVFGIAGTKPELNCIIEETSNNVCWLYVTGKFQCL